MIAIVITAAAIDADLVELACEQIEAHREAVAYDNAAADVRRASERNLLRQMARGASLEARSLSILVLERRRLLQVSS